MARCLHRRKSLEHTKLGSEGGQRGIVPSRSSVPELVACGSDLVDELYPVRLRIVAELDVMIQQSVERDTFLVILV